jgi:hypothetical protein
MDNLPSRQIVESVVYRYSRDLNEIVTPLLQGVEIGMLKI